MKALFLVLPVVLFVFTYSNQQKDKTGFSEKELCGKWTNETSSHHMKEIAPGSIWNTTFEIKNDHKLRVIEAFTKDGKELVTTTESGTWEVTNDKIIFHYSGNGTISYNGEKNKKITKNDVVLIYDGKSSKPKKIRATDLTDPPRSHTFSFKIDNNNLLLGDEKGDFKNATVFKKN